MKCVMIIDKDLPIGIQVNTSAALGISIASHAEGLIGENVIDANGNYYEGITNIPIPILGLNRSELKNKHMDIKEKFGDQGKIIVFSDIAQRSLDYDNYKNKLKETEYDQIDILGLCIYGPKKIVNKMTGNIKMLR